jgi:uncharacterized protein YoxC
MRASVSVPTIIATFGLALLAGCGGDDDSNSGSATTTTQTSSPVCAAYAQVQSTGNDLKQLDPSASASEVKQAVAKLAASVQALSSAASQEAGQTQADIKSAVKGFQSKLNSAKGQPLSEQLVTLGTALGALESSLGQTTSQLGC